MSSFRESFAITGSVNVQHTLDAVTPQQVIPDDDDVDAWTLQNQGDDPVRYMINGVPTPTDGFILAAGDTVAGVPGGSASGTEKGGVRAIAESGTPILHTSHGF